MRLRNKNKRDPLLEDLMKAWNEYPTGARATLMEAWPDLYFAVSRFVRTEEVKHGQAGDTTVVIKLPRLPGNQSHARKITEDILPGDDVILDFREVKTIARSFLETVIFYATCPPANTNTVTTRYAAPEWIEMIDEWAERSGSKVGPNIHHENPYHPEEDSPQT